MDAANLHRARLNWLAILWLLCAAAPLRAEVFELAGGGTIEGEWINRDERPLTRYQVRRQGVLLTLSLPQVIDVVRQTPAELAYRQKAPAIADTADAQWEMAEWCRQNGLPDERQRHLERVIELAGDHRPARAALGYVFHDGQWSTQEAIRRADGYELYRGKWRTPQEIEILESSARTGIAQKDWLSKLTRIRRELDEPAKTQAAAQALAAIDDPLAIAPLGQMLHRERVRSAKALYVDALLGLSASDSRSLPSVLRLLVAQAMHDKDIEVFYFIVDRLARQKHPLVTEQFVGYLASAANEDVNRAGEALGKLQDASAVSPLIDALTTTHQYVRKGAGSNATTSGFVDGNSFFKQGDQTQVVIAHVQNQHVLAALGKITGVDFGFDQKAWRNWHSQDKINRESQQPFVDVRRK